MVVSVAATFASKFNALVVVGCLVRCLSYKSCLYPSQAECDKHVAKLCELLDSHRHLKRTVS